MHKLIMLLNIIVPDQIGVLKRRHDTLKAIVLSQPVGRRALAVQMGVGERVVRTDTDFLVSQRLVKRHPKGLFVTSEGEDIITELDRYLKMSRKLRDGSEKNLQLA